MNLGKPHSELTQPGAPFEIREAVVRGQRMRVFARIPETLLLLYQGMAAHGPAEFIVDGDRRLSFIEAQAEAAALALLLREVHQVRAGDRVAIAMRNSVEWMLSFVAVSTIGALPALINSRGTGDEMRYCIEDVDCVLVVADARRAQTLRDAGFAGRVIDPESEACRQAIAAHRGAALPVAAGITADDPAAILFTSGTTGRPKGAVLTHRAILTGLMIGQHAGMRYVMQMAADYGVTPAEIIARQPQGAQLLVFPLFHISGCQSIFLSSLARGGKIVLLQRWDAGKALELIERERITAFSGPPTVIWDMLRVPERAARDLSSLASLGTGGQALAPNLLRSIQEAFPWAVIGGGYGMTETAGAISLAMGAEYTGRPECSGRLHPLAQVRVVGDDGADLASGEIGELWVRGPMVMVGYWGHESGAGKALDAEGWLRTGDVGGVDADSYVMIVDRKTDMLISSGENIYCAEVERVLMEHPEITEAAAFGVPDLRLGERLVVAVVGQADHGLTSDLVREHVSGRLAAYKTPTEVLIEADPLPRTATGKVDKRALRARHPTDAL